MTAALAFALLARQTAVPTLPPGTAPDFAKTVVAVESHLVEGDVAAAREAARALPVRQPRLAWADDATLPPVLRAARAEGLAEVMKRWSMTAKDFGPKVVEGGAADLTIGFAPVLPDGPDGLPRAARIDSAVPFHATIGLAHGKPGTPLKPVEMNAQIAYAIGRYLGVPESPLPGSAMYPENRPNTLVFMPRLEDWILAARNLDLADRVRAAVDAGKPLGLSLPTVHVAKETLELGSQEQGKPLVGTIELENLGAGPLDYQVVPDCSCFHPIAPGQVPSQARRQVSFTIDTIQYVGKVEKLLLLRSNDPERPTIELPVHFTSRPAYRLIHPGGDRVSVTSGGGTFDYFFFTPPGSPIHLTTLPRWDGMPAKVSFEPWTGLLADPEMGEGPLPRSGWRIHIRLPAALGPGRNFGTVTLQTDSHLFSQIPATLYVQKGIVADEANLGDLVPGGQGSFLIDRPNAPFKILKVDTPPNLKASIVDRRAGWEYRVDLEYTGNAPKGDFLAKIRVHTSDPKQPVVETLARGYVK